MSRKPHLVGMTNKALEEYRARLRMEQAAVLTEIALRAEIDDWGADDVPLPLPFNQSVEAPAKPGGSA